MKETTVGNSGFRQSVLGLGTQTWGRGTDVETSYAITDHYISAGGNYIHMDSQLLSDDHTRVLARFPRQAYSLALSAGVDPHAALGQRVNCSRPALIATVHNALEQLHLDHIDILEVGFWDPYTPVEELLSTLESLIMQGSIRYAAVRGYTGWQLATTVRPGPSPIIATSCAYNLLERSAEQELLPATDYLGVGFIAGAPLAQGVLSGQYRTNHQEHAQLPRHSRAANPDFADTHALITDSEAVVEALVTAAQGLGISPATAAWAWTRTRPGVSSIISTPRTLAHCREYVASATVTIPRAIAQALDDVCL